MSSAQPRDPRMAALLNWLGELDPAWSIALSSLRPASSDASFRRYFRVDAAIDGGTLIVMDAPPEQESVLPFVAVARFLGETVCVPRVLASEPTRGFLLLTDLGGRTYLSALTADNADALYADAYAALIRIQLLSQKAQLPAYNGDLLLRELQLFPQWYLGQHRGHALSGAEEAVLQTAFAALIERALAQPAVVVHRDYHSRNLMYLEANAATSGNPGILDFQDAVTGPITYDLVSLLRDAYIAWDEERVLDWTIRYWERARRAHLPVSDDFGEFWRDFEWMGLQRHLKVLGIFARLHHRDGKDNYLQDLPQVLRYTRATAARYREFFPLLRLIERVENGPSQVGLTF